MTERNVFYKNGFNPPLLIVGPHPDYTDSVWVVPSFLPWACAMLVRRDQLTKEPRRPVGSHA